VRVKCNRCARKKSENDLELTKKEETKKKKTQTTTKQKAGKSPVDDTKDKSERAGDWVCVKCKNNNFSFRVVCNRCQLSKIESDKLFQLHMNNLLQIGKVNESLQNQLQNQMMYEQNLQQMYYNNANNANIYQNNQNNQNNQNIQNENNYMNGYNVSPMYLIQKM